MAFNIAQVGVDKKSGAPIIQRSSTFNYNNDPNGTSDIFYYFGSRLRSSSFVNPSTTQFLTASRLNGGSITGPGDNAVDNSTLTNLFAGSTDATDGLQIEFLIAPFTITALQFNTNNLNWTLEGSNDGTNWTNIGLGSTQNLGSNWTLYTVPNSTAYSYYRILHGENGISKDFVAVKFFGTYQNGDIAPSIDNEAQYLATHRDGPGNLYLPDATAENFPDNYYVTFLHFKLGEYTYGQFAGGTTVVNDNANGVLKQGEQLLAVYEAGAWEVFKVGSGVDLEDKGALITSNGIESVVLLAGTNGQYLKVDNGTTEGLVWDTLGLDDLATPTANFDLGGQKIVNTGTPTAAGDYVNKAYADSIAAGFDPKASCEVATTADLDTETGLTWTPAGSGVGKTFTSNGASATIDGVSLVNGYRVLVKNQPSPSDNGIYDVTGVGSTVTLTRSTDFDESGEVTPGAVTFITQGNINIATGYILLGSGVITIDTTALNFTQFAGSGSATLASLADTNVGTPGAADNNRFVGWNNSTGFYELFQKPGTAIGELVLLEDVSSNPGLPAVDGTQLTLNSLQITPLTTKGDIWTYDTEDARLPVGADGQLLVAASGEATGLIWKTFSSTDLTIGATATDFTVNFTTSGPNTVLGPFAVLTTLAPNTDEFLRYDGTSWVSTDPTGTNTGDIVVLEDVGGNPGLPAVDGSQITNLNVNAGQGSPLTTKGDIYIFDTVNNRLPVGVDGTVLSANSVTTKGLEYSEVRDLLREAKEITSSPYTIQTDDERQVLVATAAANIELPDTLPTGFFTTIYSNQTGDISFTAGGAATIINNTTLRQNDTVIVSLAASNTWLITKVENNLLTTKGDILSYSDKSAVLPIGTTGQVLTVNTTADVGFRWEDRAGADDLIYTKEIPEVVLSATADDIFRYIGTNGFIDAFSNPTTSGEISAFTNSSGPAGETNQTSLTDNLLNTEFTIDNPGQVLSFQFNNHTVQPYILYMYITTSATTVDNKYDIEVSTDGSNWTVVGSITAAVGEANIWKASTPLTTNGYFNHLRLIKTTGASINKNKFRELKIFGWVKDNPAIGEIFAVGATGITPVLSSSDDLLLVADSTQPTGVKWDIVPSSSTSILTYTQPATTITYTKVSDLDINDLIYAFGTEFGTQAFSNPDPSIYIEGTHLNNTTERLFNRTTGQSVSIGSVGSNLALVLDLKFNAVYQPSTISIFSNANNNLTWTFEGSNDNVNYSTLLVETRQINGWEDFNVNSTNFYRYIRISNNSGSGSLIQEMQLYGDYINPNAPAGILDIPSSRGRLTNLSFPNTFNWNLPASVNAGYYTYFRNRGNTPVNIVTDNADTLEGSSRILGNSGGILIKSDTNEWTALITDKNINTRPTSETTASNTVTLTLNSEAIQVIDPGGATRDVVLPDPPEKDLYFKIVNTDAANFNLDIKETAAGAVAKTLDIDTPYVECHYTGTQWIILD